MELGQCQSMNGQCAYGTWNHAVQALDVILGNAALRANFVDEARNKLDHGIGHVTVLWVLESAFRVEALCNATGNAAKHMWKREKFKRMHPKRDTIRDDSNRIGRARKLAGISVFAVCIIVRHLLNRTNGLYEMVMQCSLWIDKIKNVETQISYVRNKHVWCTSLRENLHINKSLAGAFSFLSS